MGTLGTKQTSEEWHRWWRWWWFFLGTGVLSCGALEACLDLACGRCSGHRSEPLAELTDVYSFTNLTCALQVEGRCSSCLCFCGSVWHWGQMSNHYCLFCHDLGDVLSTIGWSLAKLVQCSSAKSDSNRVLQRLAQGCKAQQKRPLMGSCWAGTILLHTHLNLY
jgi:hypothetical protein